MTVSGAARDVWSEATPALAEAAKSEQEFGQQLRQQLTAALLQAVRGCLAAEPAAHQVGYGSPLNIGHELQFRQPCSWRF